MPRVLSLFLAVLFLTGCGGVIQAVRETPAAEAIGLGPQMPCTVSRREARGLAGAYARTTLPTGRAQSFFVTGRGRSSDAPTRLHFTDTSIGRFSPTSDGSGLSGGLNSRLLPKDGFGSTPPAPGAPRVFALGYQQGTISYVGTLVLGESPSTQELALASNRTFKGQAQLHLTGQSTDGNTLTDGPYNASFSLSTNMLSGQSVFVLEGLNADAQAVLGFSSVTWRQLSSCGARLVSSGQGLLSIEPAANTADSPFHGPLSTAISEGTLGAVFEGVQFAGQQRPAAPSYAGGVILIFAGDFVLRGVFLSDPAAS